MAHHLQKRRVLSVFRPSGLKGRWLHGCLLSLGMATISVNASTEWSQPEAERVVARWDIAALKPMTATAEETLAQLQITLRDAELPGESWRYDQAHGLLQRLAGHSVDSSSEPETASASNSVALTRSQQQQLRYYRALVLQHGHRFEAAASLLAAVPATSERYLAAQLMLAQVLAEQGQTDAARGTCFSLVTVQADLALACTAATHGTHGTHGTKDTLSDTLQSALEQQLQRSEPGVIRDWMLHQQMKGYLNSNQPEQALAAALKWGQVTRMSVADLVLLTDAYLALDRPEDVLELLPSFISDSAPDDALIVQLARAEKRMGETNYWQGTAAARMQMRIHRDEATYGELLALYFREVKDDGDMAEYWQERYQRSINEDRQISGVMPNAMNPIAALAGGLNTHTNSQISDTRGAW